MDAPGDAPADRFGVVGTTLHQKFLVERFLAEGGFGVVYAGKHLNLGVPIAVKVLKTPADLSEGARKEFIERFLEEAKTMARIRHPHIVHVLDTGVSEMPSGGEAPWIVLEWLAGITLEAHLSDRRGRGGIRAPEAIAIAKPVMEALAYAHEEGVAHRDVKPGNVMLVTKKRGPSPTLLDFGIAKTMRPSERAGSGFTATQGAMNAFSPHYAAPEQLVSARTGPWTDVHALGLMLTEMLIDRPPFDSADLAEVFREVLANTRPTPKKFGVDVGALEAVIARAVAFKPEDRFDNAGEMLAEIERVVPGVSPADLQRHFAAPPAVMTRSGEKRTLLGAGLQNDTATPPMVPHMTPATREIRASDPVPLVFTPSPTTLRSSVRVRDVEDLLPQRALRNRRPVVIGVSLAVFVGIAVGALLFGGSHAPAPVGHRATSQAEPAEAQPPSTPPSTPIVVPSEPASEPVVPIAVPVVAPEIPDAAATLVVTTAPSDHAVVAAPVRNREPSRRPAVRSAPRSAHPEDTPYNLE